MRLIIVEDDILTAEVVRDSIHWEMFGIHEVELAYNISEAQRIFEAKGPDIAICDIEMPKGSGLELLKWARSSSYKCEFIFLTNHESFEFASTALDYGAISYMTKPFNIDKTEMAVTKAMEKIKSESYLQQYSEYGKYWLENESLLRDAFWRDLMLLAIPSEEEMIVSEINRRKLSIPMDETYQLLLISAIQSEDTVMSYDEDTFEYALRKLCAEHILESPEQGEVIYYVTARSNYAAVILRGAKPAGYLEQRCTEFIRCCEEYLKCTAACYISADTPIQLLAEKRKKLEEMDQNNFTLRNKVFLEKDAVLLESKGQYVLDTACISGLFDSREKLKIINYMKRELEMLVAKGNLDAASMYSIHQDFMQIVHAFLYKSEIQAHKLFSDKVAQRLSARAVNSVFDMLKWVHYVTTRTIEYAEEIKRPDSIIDRAKQYISVHYCENITRNDVAAVVFLTPEYLAKMFKAETGTVIKDYINQCRIDRAKELIRSSDSSISRIASEVGFDNFSYFSTVFKKLTGSSPHQFRKDAFETRD